MIEWPQEVVGSIARRRAVLFLGAGVSKNAVGANGARPPLWGEFLQYALGQCNGSKQHIQATIKRGDLLTACEMIKRKLDDDWPRVLRNQFTIPRFQPADIHSHLFNLDCRVVLTVNFDKIYDTYAQAKSENTISIHCYNDAGASAALRSSQRMIVKAHGTIDQPDLMIFTREDYSRAQHQYGAFFQMLDALLLTHTFIFVGCGLDDPHVQVMLSRYNFVHTAGSPHYICMPSTRLHADLIESHRKNYGLKVIRYSPANHHAELQSSLEALVQLVDERRDEIANNRDW